MNQLPKSVGLCPVHVQEWYYPDPDTGQKCPEDCDQELVVYARVPAAAEDGVGLNQRWRYKPNRGYGTFTVVDVRGDRVTLRDALGKTKTISVRTLRGDYRREAA